MENEKVMRVTIAVLAVALVIVTILWVNARRDLGDVLGQLENGVIDYQTEIEEKCGVGEIDQQSEECQEVLRDFAQMLERYNQLISAEVEEDAMATTTPR